MFREAAGSVGIIEMLFQGHGEAAMVVRLCFIAPWFWMGGKETLFFFFPPFEDVGWNGISESPGDEDPGDVLLPMT